MPFNFNQYYLMDTVLLNNREKLSLCLLRFPKKGNCKKLCHSKALIIMKFLNTYVQKKNSDEDHTILLKVVVLIYPLNKRDFGFGKPFL